MIASRWIYTSVAEDSQDIPGVFPNRIPRNAALLFRYSHELCQSLTFYNTHRTSEELTAWLKPYQLRGLLAIGNLPYTYLRWPTGSGKTAAAILIAMLHRQPKVIVACPPGLRLQWRAAIERISTLRVQVLTGLKEQPIDADIVVVGHNLLQAHRRTMLEWFKDSQDRVLIFDEIDNLKNHLRQKQEFVEGQDELVWVDRGNAVAAAAALAGVATRTVGLSATPISVSRADLWGQLDLLHPWGWGGYGQFVTRYLGAIPGPYGGYQFDPKNPSNLHLGELKRRLSCVMNVVTKDEARKDLPPCSRTVVRIPGVLQDNPKMTLDDEGNRVAWRTVFKRAAKEGREQLREAMLAYVAESKLSYLIDAVVEALKLKKRVVVFWSRRGTCQRFVKQLRAKLPTELSDVPMWASDGGDSQQYRMHILDQWQKAKDGALLSGVGAAWGTGVDGLQHAHLAIIAAIPWTAREVIQWEGRFPRLGQTVNVEIVYPISEGTIDEHISEVILARLGDIVDVLDDEQAEAIAEDLGAIDDEAADAALTSFLDLL